MLYYGKGYKHIIFLLWKFSEHTDKNNITVFPIFPYERFNILLVGSLAICRRYRMAPVYRPVHIESIVKCSRCSCRVSAHQQLIVCTRKSTEYCFHDRICNTRSFINNEQHIIFVKTLHILWLCSSPSYGKPTLFVANHINIGLRPFEDV